MQRILMKSVLIKIGREFLFSLAVKIKMSHFLKTQFRRFFYFSFSSLKPENEKR